MKNLRATCHHKNKSSQTGTGIPENIDCNIIKKFSIGTKLELQGIAL
jgi:hypothetical protein